MVGGLCLCMFLVSTKDKEAVIWLRDSHCSPSEPCSYQGLVLPGKEILQKTVPASGKGQEEPSQGRGKVSFHFIPASESHGPEGW